MTIGKTAPVNVYPLLQNRLITTGSTSGKPLLPADSYEAWVENDPDGKVELTFDINGIYVKALEDMPRGENITVVVRILSNDGSDYSTVRITLTTEVSLGGGPGGGGGGGGGGGPTRSADPDAPPFQLHSPYIRGYPNGTFRPDGNITRAEIATMVIRALGITPGQYAVPSYSDVQRGSWPYPYIEEATSRGYLGGYPNGSFRPSSNMTRAELAAMLSRIAALHGKYEMEPETGIFYDDLNPNAWYYEEVLSAIRFGIIGTGEGGPFRPNERVTRAESVGMINRLLGRDPETAAGLQSIASPFSDVRMSHPAYLHILEASVQHEHPEEQHAAEGYNTEDEG